MPKASSSDCACAPPRRARPSRHLRSAARRISPRLRDIRGCTEARRGLVGPELQAHSIKTLTEHWHVAGKVALERIGLDTVAMFKKSVSSLLLTLMALLAAGALASTAIQMVGAFGRYSDSLETARLAAADKAIFHGVLALRNNRGDAQSAILGEDDPRAKLEAAEKAEQGGYDAIGAALATVDFARRDELAGTLKQGWSAAAPQFQLFYDEAKRPRAERKIERTNSWYDAVTKVIDTANLASTAVSNRAWMDDPFIARMIQVRRFAWQVRDRYGIHCSSLRSNVNSSKPL